MFRISLVHQAALGDTILLIPLLKSLRMRWPNSFIQIVTRPEFGQLLVSLGHADRWHSADAPEHTAWFAPMVSDHHAREPEWADCHLLLSAVSNGGDAWAAHARKNVSARHASLMCFEPRLPMDFADHVTVWHQLQFKKLQLSRSELPVKQYNLSGPVLIHPGSGGAAKCWPTKRFIELAHQLVRHGQLVRFVLGEVECEKLSKADLSAIQSEFECLENLPLLTLADMIRQSRFWIGNDSGITHLAAAIGLPGVALFGPSCDQQWRPIGPIRVLRAPHPFERDLKALSLSEALSVCLTEITNIDR